MWVFQRRVLCNVKFHTTLVCLCGLFFIAAVKFVLCAFSVCVYQETIIESENEVLECMGRVDEGVEEFFTKRVLPSEKVETE